MDTCWKNAYGTFRDAHNVLMERDANKALKGGKYWKKRIYYCPNCGQYHFTTIENKEKLYKITSRETYIRKTYNRVKYKNITRNIIKGEFELYDAHGTFKTKRKKRNGKKVLIFSSVA